MYFCVFYSSWCEETAPSTLFPWVYVHKTSWIEAIERPQSFSIGLDSHIFLPRYASHIDTWLELVWLPGSGPFCTLPAGVLLPQAVWLTLAQQVIELPAPPAESSTLEGSLWSYGAHSSALLTSSMPPLHVWPLALFAYMYPFEKYIQSPLRVNRTYIFDTEALLRIWNHRIST